MAEFQAQASFALAAQSQASFALAAQSQGGRAWSSVSWQWAFFQFSSRSIHWISERVTTLDESLSSSTRKFHGSSSCCSFPIPACASRISTTRTLLAILEDNLLSTTLGVDVDKPDVDTAWTRSTSSRCRRSNVLSSNIHTDKLIYTYTHTFFFFKPI